MANRPIEVPHRSYDDLRRAAEDFLAERHPDGTVPVPIEEIIEFAFRLDIIPIREMRTTWDVRAFVSKDMKSISIDANIQENQPAEYRYNLAHELAHLLIHRDVIEQFDFATIREWKDQVTAVDEMVFGTFEWQAHALASLILVPRAALGAESAKARSLVVAAGASPDVTEASQRMVVSNFGRLFQVPAHVVADRLLRDAVWPM